MKDAVTSGLICLRNETDIEFRVCKLDYRLYEDDSFEYVFTPYYDMIDLLDKDTFQGIPGIDLDLRLPNYTRKNRVPTFIAERVPQKNRVDLYEILESLGMEYMDPILYLTKTPLQYFGDHFYVIPFAERKTIRISDLNGLPNTYTRVRAILDLVASGGSLLAQDGRPISGRDAFDALLPLYAMRACRRSSHLEAIPGRKHRQGKYKGRKPIGVDLDLFIAELHLVESGEKTAREAIRTLGINKDKLYRLKKTILRDIGD